MASVSIRLALTALTVSACGTIIDAGSGPDGNLDGGPGDGSNASGDCGSINGDADPNADGSPTHDGGPSCTTDHPFAEEQEIADLGVLTNVRLTRDGATAFISLAEDGGASEEIFEGPFPKGANLYARVVNAMGPDTSPAPAPNDPLRLFYERAADGDGGTRVIVEASRQQLGQKLVNPVPLSLASGPNVHAKDPYVVGITGSLLYFTMLPGTKGFRDIYRADHTTGSWIVTMVDGINTAIEEHHPVVSDDELLIYYAQGFGTTSDIYYATRPATNEPFNAQGKVPLALSTNGRPAWLSSDQCTLIFTSDRAQAGVFKAYRAVRQR